MFLSTKIKNKLINNNFSNYKKKSLLNYKIALLNYCKQKFYLKKTKLKNFNDIIFYLNSLLLIKKKNYYFKTNKYITHFNSNTFNNSSLISYILKITLLKSNIIVSITNLKGIPLITYSSGLLNFKGTQKTKYLALNSIIKKIKYKAKKLKTNTFAIHFQGIKKNRKCLLNNIKNIIYIKNIRFFNLIPHNGCKSKKAKMER